MILKNTHVLLFLTSLSQPSLAEFSSLSPLSDKTKRGVLNQSKTENQWSPKDDFFSASSQPALEQGIKQHSVGFFGKDLFICSENTQNIAFGYPHPQHELGRRQKNIFPPFEVKVIFKGKISPPVVAATTVTPLFETSGSRDVPNIVQIEPGIGKFPRSK